MDRELQELISRWETLGWFDKKHICWISFWSTHEVCPKMIGTILVALVVLGSLIFEHHTTHRILLLSVVFLFYFYAIALDHFYKHYSRRDTA
ncbi:MAG: hypothetical protein ACXAEN_24130 [Candidatus Thorarchaeota archaeon]|jgi:hypothetical protein